MLGLRYIFVFFTVCSGLSLLLTCKVGNTSLKAPKPLKDEEAGIETGVSSNNEVAFDLRVMPEQEAGSCGSRCSNKDALERSEVKTDKPA